MLLVQVHLQYIKPETLWRPDLSIVASARLPPVWPWGEFSCGFSLVCLAFVPGGFYCRYPGFFFSSKTNTSKFPFDLGLRNAWTPSNEWFSNPYSSNFFSLTNNVGTSSRKKCTTINKMISKRKMPWSFIQFSHLTSKMDQIALQYSQASQSRCKGFLHRKPKWCARLEIKTPHMRRGVSQSL